MKTAVLDIGSNSVRMIVFDGDKAIFRGKINSRLGEGVSTSKTLLPEAAQRTIVAISKLVDTASDLGVLSDGLFAFATEAVRRAQDGRDFTSAVSRLFSINCRILTGEEEADIALEGVLRGGDGAVLDIGGASSELAVRENGKTIYSHSLKAGAGVLTDAFGSDLSSLDKQLDLLVSDYGELPKIKNLYAIGGTASACGYVFKRLKKYDYDAIDGLHLEKEAVLQLSEELFSYTAEERAKRYNLDENRALVLPCGARLFAKILQYAAPENVLLSERGNIEGYYSLLKKGVFYGSNTDGGAL